MSSDLEIAVNPLLRLQQGSIILRFNKQIDFIWFYGGYDWTHMVKPHHRGMVLARVGSRAGWNQQGSHRVVGRSKVEKWSKGSKSSIVWKWIINDNYTKVTILHILHPHSHFWSLFSPFEWPYLVVFPHFLHRQILRVPLYPIQFLLPIAVVLDTPTQTYLPMASRWSFHCWVSMPAFKCWWPCGWHARERGRTDHAVRGKILRDTHLVTPS